METWKNKQIINQTNKQNPNGKSENIMQLTVSLITVSAITVAGVFALHCVILLCLSFCVGFGLGSSWWYVSHHFHDVWPASIMEAYSQTSESKSIHYDSPCSFCLSGFAFTLLQPWPCNYSRIQPACTKPNYWNKVWDIRSFHPKLLRKLTNRKVT